MPTVTIDADQWHQLIRDSVRMESAVAECDRLQLEIAERDRSEQLMRRALTDAELLIRSDIGVSAASGHVVASFRGMHGKVIQGIRLALGQPPWIPEMYLDEETMSDGGAAHGAAPKETPTSAAPCRPG